MRKAAAMSVKWLIFQLYFRLRAATMTSFNAPFS
jgi:hypothetical protein